jgi:rRNA biogenesis protein RRP5
VLNGNSNGKVVDVSLRSGRINGDVDDDPVPASGDIVQGYVIQTTTKGCFVRFSRTVEGRSTLKQLCDGYIANPSSSFPMGRLVIGKIKETRPVSKKGRHMKAPVTIQADVDMRESVLVQDEKNLLSFEDINIGEKYKGTVQTVTSYGVFVRIANSNMDGLVHLSECSDKFIKNVEHLYSPGDLVKVLVLKKDEEAKKLGFSMKASHFEDDDDTDESSVESDDEMEDRNDDEMEIVRELQDDDSDDDLDSEDENFALKLAGTMNNGNHDNKGEDDDSSPENAEDDDDGDSSSEDESDDDAKEKDTLDTNVGFSWGAGALGKKAGIGTKQNQDDSSDESDSDSDNEESGNEKSNSRKSRKRQAEKRREEQETSRRETALADGTADENPETAGDFERLLAGDPNNSELWIRYMAFHLSLADIPSARKVAENALARIEFRQEKEKLNIWSALLTLEHKFGNQETFKDVIDKACKQNNPKQVYLRACEIRANEVELSSNDPTSVSKADALFTTMCKKHKSKKTVWLAHMQYLLKQSRHEDAQALMKRAMLSLATHKHAEMMSKYAQMEFELGSPERGRTIFDGLLLKYNKRLDLFFVYLDKECKFGNLAHARAMLEKKVEDRKISDRQMKSLFKKWYRMEEEHGTEETQEHVKESARTYVTASRK